MASLGMTNFNKTVCWLRSWLPGFIRKLVILKIRIRAIRAGKNAACRPLTPRQVVFVSDFPCSREAKLAYGLQQVGWEVILLYGKGPNFDAIKYFKEIQQYRNRWEALNLAARYTPVVYHVFSRWYFDTAATLVRYRPGKIVFDDYDVMAGMLTEEHLDKYNNREKLEQERYCLENADGLCCRSLETQYAKRHLGYRFRGKRLLLLDCCWADGVCSYPPAAVQEGDLHVAYSGNLPVADPADPEDISENIHYEVAALLSRHRVHYHVYPSDRRLAEMCAPRILNYLAAHGDPSYVHIHEPCSADDLTAELSHYHCGLHVLPLNVEGYMRQYTQEKFRYSTTNKIFDYLDAGLFVVIHPGAFQRFLVRRYRVGSSVSRVSELVSALRPNGVTIPDAFRLATNIGRLTKFYSSL